MALTTIQRAFEMIEALLRLDGAGPARIAREFGIPRSTAHDYLRSLETTGYVIERDGVYRISHQFLATGGRLKRRNPLYHVARGELAALARDTGEVANVSIEEGGQWILLHKELGERALDLGTYPGLHTPLHTHAAGKSILANLSESARTAIIENGLERMTEHTVTDPEELEAELAAIREDGYAIDADQQVVGMGVVAAPLLVDGSVLGAVAIVCPSKRLLNEPYRRELTQKVLESSDTITVNYRFGG
ncbi:IclR family transcriptional regulator [Halobium palmae]|uniref:IclR family transcriptional regulator n=1 Tax=Halobium palmae TaxID=1776492 RepID=A0ABD5RW33_9EURY